MSTLKELAAEVADNRNHLAAIQPLLDEAKKEFEEQNAKLIEAIAAAKATIAASEEALRQEALATWAPGQTKKLAHGIGIRETTKLDYEPDEAFNWAVEHGIALALDKKTFETIAKASPPGFVKPVTVVSVTLPTDTYKLQVG